MPAFGGEERRLLHESLQSYLGSHYTYEQHRKLVRSGTPFQRTQWAAFAELGWLGTAIPEAHGGAGGGMTELGILMSAAGQGLLLEPLLQTLVLSAGVIERLGSAAQQTDLLGRIAAGTLVAALVHYEPEGGFSRGHVGSVARRDGAGFALDGRKTFALHAADADLLLVTARVGSASGPLAVFAVPRGAPGLDMIAAPALDGRPGGEVTLKGVRLSADALLGDAGRDAAPAIEAVLDRGAAAVSAEAVGAMHAVTQQTVAYLKQRKQFGQPLSSFQVLQHRLVDMTIAGEEARAVVHAALEALDRGSPDAGRQVASAKVHAARAARFVGAQAIQLHGGMGMTDELAIGHYYKRLTMCESMFGDADWYLERFQGAI